MAASFRRLRPALRDGQELVAHVDERHAADAAAQVEAEQPAVEVERRVEVGDLEGGVVDPDQTRLAVHRATYSMTCSAFGSDDTTSAPSSVTITRSSIRTPTASATYTPRSTGTTLR